jgi:Tfp pilus assembly protein PilF
MKRRKKREGRPLKRSALLLLAALTMAALFAGCSQWKRYLDTSHARHERAPSTVSEKQIARTIAGVRPVKGNPDSHYQLALHYQTRGKYHEALREFKKTVAIDPRHVDALNGMGVSYDKLEHYGRAQKVYRAALRIKPDAPGILNNLGYSMYLQGNFAEALTILEKALALDGDNRRYRNNLARVRFETGDFEGALAEYTRGLGEAEAHVHMGASYYRIGMYGKAASCFSDALRIDPLVKGAKGGLRAARSLADISEPVAAAKEATSIEPGVKAVQALPDAPVRDEGTAEAESAPASMEEAALAAAVAAEKIEAVVSSTQAPVLAGSLIEAEPVPVVAEETDLVGSAAVKGIEGIVRSSEVSARESVPLVASGAAGAERSPEAPRFAGSLFEAERVPAVAEETDLVGSAAVKGIETIVSSSEASAEKSATLVATGAAEAERPPEAPRFAGSLVEAERVPPAEETVPAGAEELGVLVSSSEASAEESATLVLLRWSRLALRR